MVKRALKPSNSRGHEKPLYAQLEEDLVEEINKTGIGTLGMGGTVTAVEMMFQHGMIAMIGKGDRADFVADLCKKYGGLNLLSIGGASAMISNQVKTCDVIAYEDLGTESIKRLYIENLRVVVGIDAQGRSFQKQEIAKYKKD